ncbi:GNAT family N-acetyltransferase [Hungatella hominis]
MMREYFLRTQRVGFSVWNKNDIELANQLWGEADVTRFICATGKFTKQDVIKRLEIEIQNEKLYHIQYWPIFELATNELIGCCGMRPFKTEIHTYEIGFHLCKQFWGKGYASEAANTVINDSFEILNATKLFAGHHPQNTASKKLLEKLGFRFIGANFYEPTGLYHPSYELNSGEYKRFT